MDCTATCRTGANGDVVTCARIDPHNGTPEHGTASAHTSADPGPGGGAFHWWDGAHDSTPHDPNRDTGPCHQGILRTYNTGGLSETENTLCRQPAGHAGQHAGDAIAWGDQPDGDRPDGCPATWSATSGDYRSCCAEPAGHSGEHRDEWGSWEIWQFNDSTTEGAACSTPAVPDAAPDAADSTPLGDEPISDLDHGLYDAYAEDHAIGRARPVRAARWWPGGPAVHGVHLLGMTITTSAHTCPECRSLLAIHGSAPELGSSFICPGSWVWQEAGGEWQHAPDWIFRRLHGRVEAKAPQGTDR